MKVPLFIYLLSSLLVYTGSHPPQIRIRHWNKFSFMFAGKQDAKPSNNGDPGQSRRTPHPECFMQVPDTMFFRGFIQPFYTYNCKISACTIMYGVTVSHTAPNVFGSLQDCRARCCVGGSC
ncbi:hypothetical protein QR680_007929 [Steinernema hermaphroditum]|uniref:Secreted protein n=1 Tax=Steinernema hermaphroditum TaxID=289476 RepID=A0AA39IEP5_9BILA|nr:hypothetical protein QR680_007929 [Steinernema hermaphroditum]